MESITTPASATMHLAAGSGEACASCGAPLAVDQRYCVQCGERQSGARPRMATPEARASATPPAPPVAPRRRPTISAGATLIAGVGTLLVAMAVGVLIGRSGQTRPTTTASAPVRVISVPAAGSATPTPTAAPAKAKAVAKGRRAHGSGGGHHKSAEQVAKSAGVPVEQTKQAPGSTAPPPVVTQGSPGHGKGYTNGHFTGNFFGGGG